MKTTQYVRQEQAIDWTAWYFDSDARKQVESAMRAETASTLSRIAPGYLYVVEFTSDVVKVGRTAQPGVRLAHHATVARLHGGDVRQHWLSPQHFCCRASEADLIALCAQAGDCAAGREYFRMPFSKAVLLASLSASNYTQYDEASEAASLWRDAQADT